MEYKEEIVHTEDLAMAVDEKAQAVLHDATARGQMLTGYEEFSWLQTVKAFKISVLYCLLVTLAGAADGYQVRSVSYADFGKLTSLRLV